MMESTIRINSGEYICLTVFHITSIPHISILSENDSVQGQQLTIEHAGRDMVGMLTEVYQQYKDLYVQLQKVVDVSFDISWISKPVENQPYQASVDLYCSVRCIYKDEQQCKTLQNTFANILKATLKSGKYEFEQVDLDEYSSLCSHLTVNHEMKAIVKDERIEDLQNSYFPACYAFDTLPFDYPELDRIANVLIEYPYCAVSFQLMPTYYSQEELAELSQVNQNISMLNRGVNDGQIGNVSISSADRIAAVYHYYNDNKSRALFNYNILVWAKKDEIAGIATRTLGQLGTTKGQSPNLNFVSLATNEFGTSTEKIFTLPWVANDIIFNRERKVALWNSGVVSPALYRFPYVITAEEAVSFFRLPIGSDRINAGYYVNEAAKNSRTYSKNLINSGDLQLGKLRASTNDVIGLSLKDLAKHMLIVGTPGSGKTTFSVGLLDRLWKKHHIPFLVIEPAKNEYRSLVQSIPDLQVFTPGKNFISPFVFNPFVPPKNVRLETYKSTLKTAFAAGVSMSTPLDKIFEDAINNCYSDFKWLDSYTVADKGRVFNIVDFVKCFQETFAEIGYTGDARNIGRAGVVRLKSLVNLFDNYFSIPIDDLLSKPTVIELAAIENSDQKALLIALLLLSILSYVNANYIGEGGLRNFILLEEAHVLLDADTNSGGEGSANPAAVAQGLVKRMLAEIRSYGVGMAIADQSPRKVGIDIVALTDIKVAFRLVEKQDKEILADSTNMSDLQLNRLAKLKPGEAFLFFNRLDEPEEIITPDYRLDNNISISLSDDGIRQLSTYWNDKADKLRPYPECKLCPYCQASCDYNRRVLAKEVARRIFKKYVGNGCREVEKLKNVLSKISSLIKSELNDEPFNRELLSCVKVYLWRHVKYDTFLHVPSKVIYESLTKK